MQDDLPPLPSLPPPRTIGDDDRRDGSPARAVAFAVVAAVGVALLWFVATMLTGYRFGYFAVLAGFGVGSAARQGDEQTSWVMVAAAGVCAVGAIVVADYFVTLDVVADELGEPVGPLAGFDVWRSTISPSSVLFWTLGLGAALWTAATRDR